MTNIYIKTAFSFTLNAAETSRLRVAMKIQQLLDSDAAETEIHSHWQGTPDDFRNRFPTPTASDPIGGFLAIFSDIDFPVFDADFVIDEPDENGNCRINVTADQFDPTTIANLLKAILDPDSSLYATWSESADRYRPDHFSGGGFRIENGTTHWITASDVRDETKFAPRFVLTIRDPEDGLLFWNTNDGFGSLESATTFLERDAKNVTIIANDEPEWLRLPPAGNQHV